MKGSQLTSGVYWQGALNHKGVENKWGKKQGPHIYILICFSFIYIYIYIYIYVSKFLKENNANEKCEILIFFFLPNYSVRQRPYKVLTSGGKCPYTFLHLS